jgi:uncharacterized protein YdiU (UPF0061 family)
LTTTHEDILDAKTEEERRILWLDMFNERVRRKMKSRSGLITHEKAVQELKEEAKEAYDKQNEDLATFDPELAAHFRNRVPTYKEIKALDDAVCRAMADYLTRMQQTIDPDFKIMKNAYHHDNPAEFDRIVERLKRKGLL